MKILSLTLIAFFVFIFGSCKEKQEAEPDLTSQLVGVRNTDYLLLNQNDGSVIAQAELNAASSIVNFSKKNNNTLIVQITLHDPKVELKQSFEAVVTEDKDNFDRFGKGGLVKNYRLTYKSTSGQEYDSGISLYKNGNVIGGLSYLFDKKHLVMRFGY